jgi:uncharacterized membrane protein
VPHCTKCGTEVPASAQFCPSCGQPQPAAAWQPPPQPVARSGMSETTAAILSYVLGWITGIIFFLIDRRPYVRFHAAQSIVTFGGLHVIRLLIAWVFGFGWWFRAGFGIRYGHLGGFGVGLLLLTLIAIVTFVLWIVCMINAARGVRFMVPIAGEIAQNLAGG